VNTMIQPTLRFPEFDGAWKETRLGDISEFLKGKGISKSNVDIKGKLECIRYGELYTHYGEVISDIKSATNVSAENVVLSKLDDVIIPASGESAIDIATASCVKRAGIALGGDINVIRSKVDGTFLAYYLNNTRKQDVARFAQGISVIHLYSAQLKLLKISIPPNDSEALKLGLFFSSIDKKISLLKEKHALLEQYKKGVMQKLFSQEIRFKDENGHDFPDWKKGTLGDLSDKISNKNKDESITNVLTNSAKSGIVSQTDYFKKDIANQSNLGGYSIVEKDDFVYNPRISELAPVGPIKRNHVGQGVMSPLYTVFRFRDENVLDYLELYFTTTQWHRYMNSIANFGARHDRMNITMGDFFNLPIPVPSKDEMEKIVGFIKSLTKKVDLVAQQLEQTQTFKKGLLQQMFV